MTCFSNERRTHVNNSAFSAYTTIMQLKSTRLCRFQGKCVNCLVCEECRICVRDSVLFENKFYFADSYVVEIWKRFKDWLHLWWRFIRVIFAWLCSILSNYVLPSYYLLCNLRRTRENLQFRTISNGTAWFTYFSNQNRTNVDNAAFLYTNCNCTTKIIFDL